MGSSKKLRLARNATVYFSHAHESCLALLLRDPVPFLSVWGFCSRAARQAVPEHSFGWFHDLRWLRTHSGWSSWSCHHRLCVFLQGLEDRLAQLGRCEGQCQNRKGPSRKRESRRKNSRGALHSQGARVQIQTGCRAFVSKTIQVSCSESCIDHTCSVSWRSLDPVIKNLALSKVGT